jgi:hypothetical protein
MVIDAEVVEYKPINLSGNIEGRCNGRLSNCRHPSCVYKYLSPKETTCPKCSTPREFCSSLPLQGQSRCKHHGGAHAIGTVLKTHDGKGLSKILTTKMLDSYRAHYDDPDILNMTTDIALLNSRRDALVQKWQDQNVSEKQWEKLKTAYENLTYHIELGHTNKINEMLYQLGNIIADGFSDIMLWQEITKIEDQITKIKEREIKRRKTAETVITEREFRQMFGFILSIIDNRIKDDNLKNQIMVDLQKLNS